MRKLGMYVAGAVLSMVMAVTMIPVQASAKVKVAPTTIEGTVFVQGDKVTTTTDKIVVTPTKVAKKKGVTNKITTTLKSSDTKVVKVAKDGVVTFLKEGKATITVKETIATTKKVKGKKKTTKKTSTATVKVVVSEKVIEVDADGNVICKCGCAECTSGACNVNDGCNCECDECVYADYEDGELITESFDDDDDDDSEDDDSDEDVE